MEETSESEVNVPEWVQLEYKVCSFQSSSIFSIKPTILSAHENSCRTQTLHASNASTGSAAFKVSTDGIMKLLESQNIPLQKVCLLDPKAELQLSSDDGDGRFSHFLFGGILGDDPPRDRTGELRVLGFPGRHLGSAQMTTDTAVGVTKLVVEDHLPLDAIAFVDFPSIKFSPKESVEMPFRYIAVANESPLLPPGMRELLHKDLDQEL